MDCAPPHPQKRLRLTVSMAHVRRQLRHAVLLCSEDDRKDSPYEALRVPVAHQTWACRQCWIALEADGRVRAARGLLDRASRHRHAKYLRQVVCYRTLASAAALTFQHP